MRKINLGLFSLYRTELMGIATIFIVLCHAPIYGVVMPEYMKKILGNLGLGVDMFLFLSGMGMHNSYRNSFVKCNSVLYWLFKRYLRIIIPILIIVLPLSIIFNRWESGIYYFYEVSGFGTFIGYSPLWFIGCILFLYILTPFIDIVFTNKFKWIFVVFICMLCFVYPYYISNGVWTFMIQRWPCYILGYALANSIKNNKNISILYLIIIPIILYCILFLFNHKLNTHFSLFSLQGILTVSICIILIDYLHNKKINNILSWIGIISLESYITNEYILRTLSRLTWNINGYNINPGNWTFYVVGTIICLLVSFIVNRISKIIIKLIF